MKRLLVASALVALILACVTPVVNSPLPADTPRADGMPMPPPYPPARGITVADGMPMPPPYPPADRTVV